MDLPPGGGIRLRAERKVAFKTLEGYRRIRFDAQNSRIQVFAADDRGGDGIIPGGYAFLDELHRHKNLSLYRTWQGKLWKRQAQLIVISTAGEAGSEFEDERTLPPDSGPSDARWRFYARSTRNQAQSCTSTR